MIEAVSQWTGLAADSQACQDATAFIACFFVAIVLVAFCRALRIL